MDPISIMMGATSLIGTGMSLFGSQGAAKVSAQEAQLSSQVEGYNIDINSQRQQQMNLEANRQQLQDIRNSQLARSMAQSSAVNQGAQFGTGLAGGYGQISGQTNTNLLGISQNRQIANNVFADTAAQDTLKMQMASLGGQAANYQGMASLGNSLTQASGPLSRMAGSLGGLFGGGGSMGSGGMGLSLTNTSGLY
jgi:hypothetical protein